MSPSWFPGPETRAAVVRHPFFLAGLAVVVLLGLTAGTLVVIDSARGSNPPATPPVVVAPIPTSTVGPTSMTATAEGVTATANDILTVSSAPGSRTAVGTLAKGDQVVIDGRTTDSNWYRIIFPPLSELHGWVEATSVTVTGDPSTLAVTTAEPPVYVEVPTTPPDVLTARAASLTPVESETPDVTPTVSGSDQLPDLVIGTPPTISGGKLFVTVVNQGQGPAKGDIVVAVFNEDGTKLLGGATLPDFTLEPGRSIDVGTGYEVTENQTLLLIVDPNGDIAETDDTNNRATVAIAVGNPPTDATPVDTPAG